MTNYNEKFYEFEIIKNLLFLLSTPKNKLSSLNFSVFDLQASYFGEKCIDECATVSYFRNYQTNNCNEVNAKWRTCSVGGLAPVSPTRCSTERSAQRSVCNLYTTWGLLQAYLVLAVQRRLHGAMSSGVCISGTSTGGTHVAVW